VQLFSAPQNISNKKLLSLPQNVQQLKITVMVTVEIGYWNFLFTTQDNFRAITEYMNLGTSSFSSNSQVV